MENSPDYQQLVIETWMEDITKIAWKFTGKFGAELDDLVQEGMISVWMNLEAGKSPSKTAIKHRMINWVDHIKRHQPYKLDVVHATLSV